MLELLVSDKQQVAADIFAFTLSAVDGQVLPDAEPGANLPIQVTLPDGQLAWREYSLVARAIGATTYQIAVLRVADGRGGSLWMHQLEIGQPVSAKAPVNAFTLVPQAKEYLLIAGGIGITPLLSMARHLHQQHARFQIHYAARSTQAMAFADEVRAFGSSAYLYQDDQVSMRTALPQLLDSYSAGRHLYVCGPQSLISAVVAMAGAQGWPSEAVHYELFQGALVLNSDKPFELVLEQSGIKLTVGSDQTILEAMIAAGVEPLYDCARGECGMCTTTVLKGTPDHRDHYLSAREQEKGDQICLCVSRARSASLTIEA
ncbi:Flavodoxin reductases (ferredoxin-NADPH reductases) family 1 [Marinobacterium lacunae]|uniref:Flavodoxin reductases (Ferredoxin-NADPH reductases) family 1 n=1 Tax=Marinobacterium lacunae TaxID=1232683 RepID=A0A081G0Z0_9GAMM|nr:PDR/VanB family oxidoreductase [Marinobacterium lacunae]KEA64445.1 Flavodoxin reductases (ferredoxin-NADPH reductases) family 1 [Marinobacterium lacunae]